MIRHFVIFTFEPDFFTEEHLVEYKEAFAMIQKDCPEVLSANVHKNCVNRPANMDLMVELLLQDENSLGTYLNHPEHVRMGKKYNPHVTNRVSFDYVEKM